MSHLRSRSSCVLLPDPSIPSTMISRPGSPSAGRGTSGATRNRPNFEAETERSLGAASRRLERPRVHHWRNQCDAAVAPFKGSRIEVGATVPHHGIRETNRGRDLLHNWLVGNAKQWGKTFHAGLTL